MIGLIAKWLTHVWMLFMKVPKVTFDTKSFDSGSGQYKFLLSTEEIFSGSRIVLFAVPGAFTPICSARHLPGYEKIYTDIRKCNIDEVYCLSVNDSYVMTAWAESLNANNVKMIPDGTGEFTRKMGMLVYKDNVGYGLRSWRYSMVVNDHNIEKLFSEDGFGDNCNTDPFDISDAETMLKYLKSQ